jgi:hypothetical protein
MDRFEFCFKELIYEISRTFDSLENINERTIAKEDSYCKNDFNDYFLSDSDSEEKIENSSSNSEGKLFYDISFSCLEFECANIDMMKQFISVENDTYVGKIIIALFYIAICFAKGRKSFIKSFISYICLCLPKKHNFPKIYFKFEKVIIYKEKIDVFC